MKTITVGGISYLPEAKTLIAMKASRDIMKEPDDIVKIDKHEIVPWGASNTLPADIIEKIGKSEVIGANLEFNVMVGYGTGIKPMRRIIEGNKLVGHEEIYDDDKVLEFFENNDINGYFLEQLTDLKTFYNVFPEIILSNDKKSIVSLRHKEAAFSRWGKMDPKKGRITKHYYSAKWGDSNDIKDIAVTDVLDRYNPKLDLEERIKKGDYKELRFIVPVNMPTPGRTYYQMAYWWSIFQSGWYDFSLMIPEAKKALMKHRFGVKYIIYLSPKYFKTIFKEEGIDPNDKEATQERIDKEHQFFTDFLTGSENSGRGIVALKEVINTSNGAKEEKYIEVEEVNLGQEGGEFNEDSVEVNSIISYAMHVDQDMPGKKTGGMSGTDKRERFMIKQALMKPFRDRLLRPLTLVKSFNNWEKNIVFAVPDIEFTTLDKNKSGKQLKLNE